MGLEFGTDCGEEYAAGPAIGVTALLVDGIESRTRWGSVGPTGRAMVWLVNALEVPDLDVASVRARAEAEQAVATIAAGLARGERFILWPAGRVWREVSEGVRGAPTAGDVA